MDLRALFMGVYRTTILIEILNRYRLIMVQFRLALLIMKQVEVTYFMVAQRIQFKCHLLDI